LKIEISLAAQRKGKSNPKRKKEVEMKKSFVAITVLMFMLMIVIAVPGCLMPEVPGGGNGGGGTEPPPEEEQVAPILSPIGNKTVNEGEMLIFSVLANDANGDVLQYAAQGLPEGATFSSQIFCWQPAFNQTGSYQVSFEVSDGSLTDTETITVTVLDVVLEAEVNINRLLFWARVSVELPEGYFPSQIDLNSVELHSINSTVWPLTDPTHWFIVEDSDEDGLWERMIFFNWNEVESLLVAGNNTLSVTGKLLSWPLEPEFSGNYTVEVIP